MGPVRTEKSNSRSGSSSNPIAGPSKRKFKHSNTNPEPSVSTGVQKIKAAIRQTKRLLAKEKLAADVRVTTERKLKSLEADLAKAEINRKERTLSTRYHKVKFFERQKVVRKINQTKKKISEANTSSSRKILETELYEHRVDLNYINHYPKIKKYISLFPPEVRNKSSETLDPPSAQSNEEREGIKKWVREQMEAGSLPGEPEDVERSKTESNHAEWETGKNKKTTKRKGAEDAVAEEDDFFENDEESEEEDE